MINTNIDFYVSTAAFIGREIFEITQLANQHNFGVEFSSGMPYAPDLKKQFLTSKVKKLAHNYFPAPEIPFVLNLASSDPCILETSIKHALQGIDLTAAAGASFYSVHAGFRIDPAPKELGHSFSRQLVSSENESWDIFISSVNKVIIHAENRGVRFLIENNVCIDSNLDSTGRSLLLCSTISDLKKLCEKVPSKYFGLLIDTGHLKVSAQTLNFSKGGLSELVDYIWALHHSDNDGRSDTNLPLTGEYWFLKLMNQYKKKTHILEVLNQTVEQVQQQYDLLNTAANQD
jgi:sugar phosphate isomerase/epimerase